MNKCLGYLCKIAFLAFIIVVAGPVVLAADSGPSIDRSAKCRTVRFADTGWSDIAAITAVTSRVLVALGYQSTSMILSLPVTYIALKNNDVDVFLGTWIPSQNNLIKPFLDGNFVEKLAPNLEEAKYSLAVMDYTYEAGLKDFSDIINFKEPLGGKIYGVEAGNEGNDLLLNLIAKDALGLGGFRLVESSERAMLAEVDRMTRKKKDVVFLAWAPHPMNNRYNIKYLSDSGNVSAGSFGKATVYTTVRAGYSVECGNVARFLQNLRFTVSMENELLSLVLSDEIELSKAVEIFLKKHRKTLYSWLDGVKSFDGGSGLLAAIRDLGLSETY